MAEGTNELLQLWTSVSSALCGCVNNPQNGTHTSFSMKTTVEIETMQ